MTAPLVSIVVPTHNRAALLPLAVDSCLRQDHADIEVIVVDDGSTDGTAEVLAGLQKKDRRIQVHRQENTGLPGTLNRGFAAARGEYRTWISDDNTYHPAAVSSMLSVLRENPQYGLVYTDFNIVDSQGKILKTVIYENPADLRIVNVVGASFLYRRGVAERVGGYDGDLKFVEDWDYWLRLASLAPITRLGRVLYDYLDHPQTLTRQAPVAVMEATYRMRLKTPFLPAREPSCLWALSRRLSTHYWSRRQRMRACLWRARSWRHRLAAKIRTQAA